MKSKKHVILSAICILTCLGALPASAQDDFLDSLKSIAIIEQKVMVPMRDGVRLATDVYRPKTDKPVPVIFSKTPYNFNSWRDGKTKYPRLPDRLTKPSSWVTPTWFRTNAEGIFLKGNGTSWGRRQPTGMMPFNGWQSSPGLTARWD